MELVTLEEAQAFLDTDEDLTDAIRRASVRIRNILQNPIIYESFTERLHGGHFTLITEHYPLVDDTVIITDLETGGIVQPDYIAADSGIIEYKPIWDPGHRRYQVKYTAGWAATTEEVPSDIKTATLYLVQEELGEDLMVSENIGDYGYRRFADSSLWAKIRAILEPYRKR